MTQDGGFGEFGYLVSRDTTVNHLKPACPPSRWPRRIIVSRWMPVRRALARMLTPSVSAAMAATRFSRRRMFVGPIHPAALAGERRSPYTTVSGHSLGTRSFGFSVGACVALPRRPHSYKVSPERTPISRLRPVNLSRIGPLTNPEHLLQTGPFPNLPERCGRARSVGARAAIAKLR